MKMTLTTFEALNKYMGIIFLTDEQVSALSDSSYYNPFPYDCPMYDLSLTGSFGVSDSSSDSLHTIYGVDEKLKVSAN